MVLFDYKIISKPYLILCEGLDECNFLCWFLNSKELHDDKRFSRIIQIIDFGGIKELTEKLAIIKNIEGYENVSRILIIRDAETNAEAAVKSIQSALDKNGLPVPEQC